MNPANIEVFRAVTNASKPLSDSFLCKSCFQAAAIFGRRLRDRKWICAQCAGNTPAINSESAGIVQVAPDLRQVEVA